MKHEEEFEDDGRTIVNMNVEGMPWYMPESDINQSSGNMGGMDDRETKLYKWAAVKAGLLIALIFGLVYFLFILFCDKVWFA